MYNLIRVETCGIPKDEQVREVVFTGEYLKCLGKFQSLSGFSFMNNNSYSYTHFFIEEATEEIRVCAECETKIESDTTNGDEGLCVCPECDAVESYKYI